MDRYDLNVHLPQLYQNTQFSELQRVLGEMIYRAATDVELTMDQLWPHTASGWGLELWETAYGIPTDILKPTEYRRARVISKLRGQGVATVELIRTVAESFVHGSVDVIEHNDKFYFVIKFTSTIGIPPNINDLTAAIQEIKPAHLDFTYEYLYRQWGQLYPYTWSQLITNTWRDAREGTLL